MANLQHAHLLRAAHVDRPRHIRFRHRENTGHQVVDVADRASPPTWRAADCSAPVGPKRATALLESVLAEKPAYRPARDALDSVRNGTTTANQ